MPFGRTDEYNLVTNKYLEPVATAAIELPYRYTPYPFQREVVNTFFDMLEGKNTLKRYCLELHRRAGKDMTFWQLVVSAAISSVGDYAYMLPTHTQAKKVIWNGTVNDDKGNPCKFFDFVPPSMNPMQKVSENRLELSNGSNIYILGSDNYDGLVGMNLAGVVFSEWSLCNPAAYDYLSPMLRRAAKLNPINGWALFCHTPRGKNHAYKTRNIAQLEKNRDTWFFMSKSVEDTVDHQGNRLIDDNDIQEELDNGADPDIIKQEYYLDYDAAVKGVIYGKQMEQARQQGRVRLLPIDSGIPVLTFWDIGISQGNATAIWLVQPINAERLNVIGYFEDEGEGVDHYLKLLKEFCVVHNCKLGTMYYPHDGANKEWVAGEKRHEQIIAKGYDVTVLPRTSDVELGIDQTKQVFHKLYFHEVYCGVGLNHLDRYRRKRNRETDVLGSPLHDESSNSADALRQLGQYYGDGTHINSSEDIFKMQVNHRLHNNSNNYNPFDNNMNYNPLRGGR